MIIQTPSNDLKKCKEHLFDKGICINCGKIHPIYIELKRKEIGLSYCEKVMGSFQEKLKSKEYADRFFCRGEFKCVR